MRTEGAIFVGVAVFFTAISAIYWFTSYEEAGSVMLLLCGGLGAIPGAWLMWLSRRAPPRPEDREDAEISAGAGPVGAFPESSVWPIVFAIGISLAGVGFVFGVWFALPGLPLALAAVVGGIAEGRRGAGPSVGSDPPPTAPHRPCGEPCRTQCRSSVPPPRDLERGSKPSELTSGRCRRPARIGMSANW